MSDPVDTNRHKCPDGGYCHHGCAERCWRVSAAGPLSGVFPDDEWPASVIAEHAELTGWERLCEWIADDPDNRIAEVMVQMAEADAPEVIAGGTVVMGEPTYALHYQVEATQEGELYGGDVMEFGGMVPRSMTSVVHQGSGWSLDEAADNVLTQVDGWAATEGTR